MSFASQFGGGSDINRLKLKAGPYLDEVAPPLSNHHIRDFTAQNDHLMISTTNGRVFIGKRFNELLECRPHDSSQLFAPSYDFNIGGDPFPTALNRYTTAISGYSGANTDQIRTGSYGIEEKTIYLNLSSNVSVNGNNNNPASGGYGACIKRFMYSGDDLFYINWHQSPDILYIYQVDNSNGAWSLASWTYSGAQTLNASGNFNFGGCTGCTWPELDPATGDIIMFMQISSNSYKLTYDHSANSWTFTDSSGLNAMPTNRPNNLSINGTTMMIAASSSSNGTYLVSTNSGANWTSVDAQTFGNYYFKECGVANGRFYTINTMGANNSTYAGMLMSTTTPQTVSSWQFESVSEVPSPQYLRNNGLGTACYVSTGYPNAQNNNHSLHSIKKLTGS